MSSLSVRPRDIVYFIIGGGAVVIADPQPSEASALSFGAILAGLLVIGAVRSLGGPRNIRERSARAFDVFVEDPDEIIKLKERDGRWTSEYRGVVHSGETEVEALEMLFSRLYAVRNRDSLAAAMDGGDDGGD